MNSEYPPESIRLLSGTCPDASCQSRLIFLSTSSMVDCPDCGQQYVPSCLGELVDENGSTMNKAMVIMRIIIGKMKPEFGTDNVKVNGLSSFKCKLLSPFLTLYGMDKVTGQPQLLTDMAQPRMFDCGILCDRAFSIEQDKIRILGYGQDRSGSSDYLKDTLLVLRDHNCNEERLVPLHVDGDGHCLVHAISRALVGRELFWHSLRINLMNHFCQNLHRYRDLLRNFIDASEWDDIIGECHPDFVPRSGEMAGLRNIHIFGVANILKRPIILLDSLKGMDCSGDYSGVFLPALLSADQCMNRNGALNLPLCIAWNNSGRNHFIPLVGINGKPHPQIPRYMLQSTWGVNQTLLDVYVKFENGCCTVGGSRMLQESYLLRLASAMEQVFYSSYHVTADLVANSHLFIFKSKEYTGAATMDTVRESTQRLVQNRCMLVCLRCQCLAHLELHDIHELAMGGKFYNSALHELGELNVDKCYTFKDLGFCCRYDNLANCLVPDITEVVCKVCNVKSLLRHVKGDGTVEYQEGDVTLVKTSSQASCMCGFKHYYGGKLYDTVPQEFPIPMEWGGKKVMEHVQWWSNESDPVMNSNVYQVAKLLVQKHFPGEFGVETLEQRVVSAILSLTAANDNSAHQAVTVSEGSQSAMDAVSFHSQMASKIILSGYKSVHKEELIKSKTEMMVKKRIERNAGIHNSMSTFSTSNVKGGDHNVVEISGNKSPLSSELSSQPNVTQLTTSARLEENLPSAPTFSSPPTPDTSSTSKRVCITVPSGKSATVTLQGDVTFRQLQQLVHSVTEIRPNHQKLRFGFPPKVLGPSHLQGDDTVIPLIHGDKVMVEEVDGDVKVSGNGAALTSDRIVDSMPSAVKSNLTRYDAKMPDDSAIIDVLFSRLLQGQTVSNDLAATLELMPEVLCTTLWAAVQNAPRHFRAGGMYYLQAQRGMRLSHDHHVHFPSLPGKVFAYNESKDRLELCLGKQGHFEVQRNVEGKAQQVDVVKPCPHRSTNRAVPFSPEISNMTTPISAFKSDRHVSHPGTSIQGCAAMSETRMPSEDVSLEENIQAAARRLQEFCSHFRQGRSSEFSCIDESHPGTIEEDPAGEEEEQENSDVVSQAPAYVRKGPGYSVLLPPPPPVSTTDAVHRLFHSHDDLLQHQCPDQLGAASSAHSGHVSVGVPGRRQQSEAAPKATSPNEPMDTS